MSERLEVGSQWGRWTIVRRTSPAQRYTEAGTRSRVIVRCVCGHEQAAFESDLRAGKTGGCKSAVCVARWRAVLELRAHLDGLLRAFLEGRAPGARE